jgi:DNA-binding HxlR family transcriptional regulator
MKSLADYEQKFDRLQENCPVRAALDVIRGRWKPSILYELKAGARRFSQLQAALPTITAQALTVQLRQLEADGLDRLRVRRARAAARQAGPADQ